MCHYARFSQIKSHISKISRFHGSLYEISMSCWCQHFIMLHVGSYRNCKRFLVQLLHVSCGCRRVCQVASQVDMNKRVLVDCLPLITFCCARNRLCPVLPYPVLIIFRGSSCQYWLDLLVTRSSKHFTQGKFARELGMSLFCFLYHLFFFPAIL